MKILITGGMGFVGSRLAVALHAHFPRAEITCFDNLRRRGSETNLPALQARGIRFVHGDIRNPSDFAGLGIFDLLIEASAEPSVHAGLDGSPDYVFDTNLSGTFHCMEFARRHVKRVIFLSTSRVYSIAALKEIKLDEEGHRFKPSAHQTQGGISERGIAESFDTSTARSLYGTTKLASEYLLQEYAATYGLEFVVNRCGVIAGPGQFGKVDQGVFALWVAHHYFGKALKYNGWGGRGLQVRDILHPIDLFHLVLAELDHWEKVKGLTFNAGGGVGNAVSLAEWTQLSEAATGRSTQIGVNPETATVDIPYYVSDNKRISETVNWAPRLSASEIAREIHEWIKEDEAQARRIFSI